jgi:MtN3 and saliva related transmembrane protein
MAANSGRIQLTCVREVKRNCNCNVLFICNSVSMSWLSSHTEAIGFWAAILTTVAFAPQVVRTWRVGGEELSWTMLALFGTGIGLWFVYGYLRMSEPLMFANGLTGLQIFLILGLKLWRVMAARRSERFSRG